MARTPAWFVKLVVPGLTWGYLHHFCAGVRHLWMDATHQRQQTAGAQLGCGDVGHQLGADRLAGRQALRPVLILFGDPSHEHFGSKRLVVGAHYGLRDWLAQRITAVLMALFTVALLAQLEPGAAGL